MPQVEQSKKTEACRILETQSAEVRQVFPFVIAEPGGRAEVLDNPWPTPFITVIRPHRLEAQDVGFSVLIRGFESRWGYRLILEKA